MALPLALLVVVGQKALLTSACTVTYEQCQTEGDCCEGECYRQSEWYSQCLPSCPTGQGWDCESGYRAVSTEESSGLAEWSQCGGQDYSGDTECQSGLTCYSQHIWYSQCLRECPEGWACELEVDAKEMDLSQEERIVMTYHFADRCDNYELSGCDNSAPVDDSEDTTLRPYRGTRSVQGVWYFDDVVQYEKDADTMKVSITYAHDPLNAQRKRVIMMATDQSRYLEYDEVIDENDEGEEVVYLTKLTTEQMSAIPGQGNGNRRLLEDAHMPLEGDSRLSEAAQVFHRAVRRSLLGFGNVHINLPGREHLSTGVPSTAARRLEDDDSLDSAEVDDDHEYGDDEVISFEPPLTDSGATSKMEVNSTEDLFASGNFTDEEKESADLSQFTHGAFLQTDDVSGWIAKSLLRNSSEDIVAGKIEWPDVLSDFVEVLEGFEDGIPSRHDLDSMLVEDTTTTDQDDVYTGEDSSSRRLRSRVLREGAHKTEGGRRLAQRMQQALLGGDSAASERGQRRQLSTEEEDECEPNTAPWSEKREESGMDEDTWTAEAYPEPASSQATNLRDEVVGRLYGSFSELAKTDDSVMGQVDAAASKIMDGVQEARDFEEDLVDLEKTMKTTATVLKLLTPIPYIGSTMKTLGTGVKKATSSVVTPAKKRAADFNERVEDSGIERRACTVSSANDNLATKLYNATVQYDELALIDVLEFDRRCTNGPLQELCQRWADVHEPVNDQIDELKEELQEVLNKLDIPAEMMEQVLSMVESRVYEDFLSFFDGIGAVLSPVTELLDKRISVQVPMPVIKTKRVCANIKYPCGVKMCKKRKKVFGRKFTIRYPCGTKICSKRVCANVKYPAFVMKRFTFTVGDIVSGALSIVDFVMALFEKLIENMMKALNLPSFPSIEDLVPAFPQLDLEIPSIPELPVAPALPVPDVEGFVDGLTCSNVADFATSAVEDGFTYV